MTIVNGNCLDILKDYPDNYFTTIITDPPYGLHFMGKKWDDFKTNKIKKSTTLVYKTDIINGVRIKRKKPELVTRDSGAREAGSYDDRRNDEFQEFMFKFGIAALRVLKPGGTIVMFGSPRRYHRQVCGLEDAGFILKDCLMWLYGSGFPKAIDISKQMDKIDYYSAKEWNEYKSHGLKPAYEPIILAMKPNEGSYAQNALKWGVSGLNIDAGRVRDEIRENSQADFIRRGRTDEEIFSGTDKNKPKNTLKVQGRFPANIILDEEVAKDEPWKRFFKNIEVESECSLCYNTYAKATKKELCQSNNKSVQCAERNGQNTNQTKENIVHLNAEDLQEEQLVRLVRFAGNLCEKCAIDIVQNLVVISGSQKDVQSQEVSQTIQGFITSSKKCILIQNLVNYVEKWDSIDTTQTTQNLLKLFGYVNRVITNCIQEIKKLEPKRFLYQAKASKNERNAGCEGLEERVEKRTQDGGDDTRGRPIPVNRNHHPTVKPLKLMEYLIKLTMPPKDGLLLDPFAGSGSTLVAAKNLGYDAVGIELEKEYCEIAMKRIGKAEEATTKSVETGSNW